MAEAADHPADKGVTASIPEAPPPPGAAGAAPQVYGSVSVVAIVGLALAALYALVIGAGGLIALFNHTPLLLPIWTLVFPVAAAGVCWAARTQIRKSEGALTGTRLATWGAGLAAVVGLLYAAYYAGCYFAVSSQATTFVNQWMDQLNKRRFDQAFLYTQPPPRPADDERLRDRLEMDFDRGQGGHGGLLTAFRESELVHQFDQGGGDAQVQFLGVQEWGYDKGGYSVVLRYRVTTNEMLSELVVTAVGVDDDSGERQWYAKNPQPAQQPVLTPEGLRMQLWTNQAREFGEDWLEKVAAGDWDEAYLETLPFAARDDRRKERETFPAFGAGAAGLPGSPTGQGSLLAASALVSGSELVTPWIERRKAFTSGNVVHFDPDTFWVGPKENDPAKDAARRDFQAKLYKNVCGFFAADRKAAPQWILARGFPTFHRNGDLARVGFDMEIVLETGVIQGRLWVTADVSQSDLVKDQWRVESLDLLSHKSGSGAPPARPQRP